MASWKKVLVSGSDASLNTLEVSGSIVAQSVTGSISGSFVGDGSGLVNVPTSLIISGANGSDTINLKTDTLLVTGSGGITTDVTDNTLTIRAVGLITSSEQVNFNDIINKPALVSSSAQIEEYELGQLKLNQGIEGINIIVTSSLQSGIFNQTVPINPTISAIEYSGTTVEYTAQRSGAVRTGTIMGSWSGSVITYTDISNTDVGETYDLTFNFIKLDDNIRLRAYSVGSGSGEWTIHCVFKLFPNVTQ